jgi:hypothetical protein
MQFSGIRVWVCRTALSPFIRSNCLSSIQEGVVCHLLAECTGVRTRLQVQFTVQAIDVEEIRMSLAGLGAWSIVSDGVKVVCTLDRLKGIGYERSLGDFFWDE